MVSGHKYLSYWYGIGVFRPKPITWKGRNFERWHGPNILSILLEDLRHPKDHVTNFWTQCPTKTRAGRRRRRGRQRGHVIVRWQRAVHRGPVLAVRKDPCPTALHACLHILLDYAHSTFRPTLTDQSLSMHEFACIEAQSASFPRLNRGYCTFLFDSCLHTTRNSPSSSYNP